MCFKFLYLFSCGFFWQDEPTPPMPGGAQNQELSARANVLNRVGHQQDKWKRQVREQRRHIYDRHTMLN